MQQKLPTKKQVAEALLSQSASVFVHLDPRRDRVVVPLQFRKQPHLILEIGLNMAVPIPDLALDDDAVTCTLSFSRSPVWCRLTWDSIFALVSSDQRGMVWPEDVPAEVAHKFGGAAAPGTKSKPPKPRLVKSEPPPAAAPEALPEPSEPAKASSKPPLAAVEAPVQDDEPVAAEAPQVQEAVEELETEQPDDKGKKKRPSYLRVVK